MIALTDRCGRPWTARLDVAAAMRIRDLAGFDVMATAIDAKATQRLSDDPSIVAMATYALFLPECDRQGIGPKQFAKRLRGWPWRWAVKPSDLVTLFVDECGEFFAVPELAPGRAGKSRDKLTSAALWGDVWRLAGLAGVNPLPHTFGELVALADAKRKHDWSQTANLLSMAHNCNARRGRDAAEFDPTGGLKPSGRSGRTRIENTFGPDGRPDGCTLTEY